MEYTASYVCPRPIYSYFSIIITILYKLVLHAVGLVLAFLTRNIKVDVLNDYRYNSAIIIASSLLIIAVCFTIPPLSDYINWNDTVWAILAFLLISVNLGLTFIPKVGSVHVAIIVTLIMLSR